MQIAAAAWCGARRHGDRNGELPVRDHRTNAGRVLGASLALGLAGAGAALAYTRKVKAEAEGTRLSDYDPDADAVRTVTIRKERGELYRFWRDFTNLEQVMENLEAIRPGDAEGVSEWVVRAPIGRTVTLCTRVTEDRDGETIAWESVEGSDIATRGRVSFADAPGDRGTRVTLQIDYDPPAGELGRLFAKLFRREPAIQARHDLKRFKMLMETGEIATSARRREDTRAARQKETA